MVDPTTVNKLLSVPTRGSDVGTWDTPVNSDFASLDGYLGGVQSISLSNVNVTLTKPTGTAVPAGGPTQAENAVIKFSGTLTGNVVITFPLPGYYIVRNNATVGTFYVQARALGTGNLIGLPPGQPVYVWNDGTDCDFVNLGLVGQALDLHTNTTALPAWMTACSVAPYLIKNGGVHTASLYPALAAQLGSTYGGNGATTFGVPDELSRIRLPVDSSGSAGRVTQAISGINGTTFASAGGDQRLQTHTHTGTTPITGIDNGSGVGTVGAVSSHANTNVAAASGFNVIPSSEFVAQFVPSMAVTLASSGAGASQNMPPAIVDFLPLIKT